MNSRRRFLATLLTSIFGAYIVKWKEFFALFLPKPKSPDWLKVFKPRRITFPLFEIHSNPMICIPDLKERRYDLVERSEALKGDYVENFNKMLSKLQKQSVARRAIAVRRAARRKKIKSYESCLINQFLMEDIV